MKKGRVAAAVRAEPHLNDLLRDPETAAAYLNEAVKENDQDAFLQALRHVAEAFGGVGRVAAKAGLNRQQLYKTLAKGGNPEIRTLLSILTVAKLGLSVKAYGKRPAAGGRKRARARPISRIAAIRRAAPSAFPRE
jgi:probable addiction module antidote protein